MTDNIIEFPSESHTVTSLAQEILDLAPDGLMVLMLKNGGYRIYTVGIKERLHFVGALELMKHNLLTEE
jgi:hypothetical protein